MLQALFQLQTTTTSQEDAQQSFDAAADAAFKKACAAYDTTKTTLMGAGKLLYLYDLKSDLWDEEGLFRVHGYSTTPSPSSGLALACAERDHERYRGLAAAISRADARQAPQVHVQTAVLPTLPQHRPTLDRIFVSVPPQKQAECNKVTDAKQDEVEGRKDEVADFSRLNDTAKLLLLGKKLARDALNDTAATISRLSPLQPAHGPRPQSSLNVLRLAAAVGHQLPLLPPQIVTMSPRQDGQSRSHHCRSVDAPADPRHPSLRRPLHLPRRLRNGQSRQRGQEAPGGYPHPGSHRAGLQ